MNNASITIMLGLCIIGCSSLFLFYFINRTIQQSKIRVSQPIKKIKSTPSEKFIEHFLKDQKIKNNLFVFENKQLTLSVLLNQSEIEFSKTDINYTSFKTDLELSLEEYFSSQSNPAYFSGYFKQSPNLYSKLIYLVLAGYVIAKAGISLIGHNHFNRLLSEKLLNQSQFKLPYPKQFYSGNISLLKAATIIPWGMISHAFDYWLANSISHNQLNLEIQDTNFKEKLFKDIMLVGYEVAIRYQISNHRYSTII